MGACIYTHRLRTTKDYEGVTIVIFADIYDDER